MLRVRPALHTHVSTLLAQQPSLLEELVHGMGSPLNVVFPTHVQQTVASFDSVLREEGVEGAVYVSHKPNRSVAVKRQLATIHAGADVSSHEELVQALAAGYTGDRIIATGIKNASYIRLALEHRVTLIADSIDEIVRIAAAAREREYVGSVLIRLNHFSSPHVRMQSQETRFGIRVEEVTSAIAVLVREQRYVRFVGFAFHFSKPTAQERIAAVEQTLAAHMEAVAEGLSPTVIDIGGGFPVAMAASVEEWNTYTTALKQSVIRPEISLTWNDHGLGYRRDASGALAGGPVFEEQVPDRIGAEDLRATLRLALPSFQEQSVADVLRDLMLTIWVEPGRAIFDQVGCTVARVLDVKHSAHGETVVVLDMNYSNLNATEFTYMVDPLFVGSQSSDQTDAPTGMYFAGNLCLSDMIIRRKVFMSRVPRPGELMLFANTAAYRMDFVESSVLLQPTAAKVAMWPDGTQWRWCIDSKYEPK